MKKKRSKAGTNYVYFSVISFTFAANLGSANFFLNMLSKQIKVWIKVFTVKPLVMKKKRSKAGTNYVYFSEISFKSRKCKVFLKICYPNRFRPPAKSFIFSGI